MEIVLTIAVLIGIGFVINWAKDGLWKQANQKVLFRGQHARGKTAVGEPTTITTNREPAEVVSRIVEQIAAPDAPRNAVYPTVYLAGRGERALKYVCGSRIQDLFTVMVQVDEHQDGSLVKVVVPSWTESDGLVAQLKELEQLRDSIVAASR